MNLVADKAHDCVLAIVGSRDLPAYSIESKIKEVLLDHKPKMVISGGAKGVDRESVRIALELGIQTMEFLPSTPIWAAPGNGTTDEQITPDGGIRILVSGGFKIRNEAIAQACDCLVRISSPDTKTYGSGFTADLAEQLGKNVERFVVGQ